MESHLPDYLQRPNRPWTSSRARDRWPRPCGREPGPRSGGAQRPAPVAPRGLSPSPPSGDLLQIRKLRLHSSPNRRRKLRDQTAQSTLVQLCAVNLRKAAEPPAATRGKISVSINAFSGLANAHVRRPCGISTPICKWLISLPTLTPLQSISRTHTSSKNPGTRLSTCAILPSVSCPTGCLARGQARSRRCSCRKDAFPNPNRI